MENLDRVISEIRGIETDAIDRGSRYRINPASRIIVCFLFLLSMLTFSVFNIIDTIPYAIIVILLTLLVNIPLSYIFRKTKYLLLFVFFIAAFNPLLDRRPAININGFIISYGWLSFFTIILRGYISVTAAMILILSSGFIPLCRGMEKLKIPKLLVTQLLFVYRYIIVLLEELAQIINSVKARGYGKNKFPVKLWSVFIAQLLIKTYSRAEMINYSMIARGYDGDIKTFSENKWQRSDTVFCIVSILIIGFLRFFRPFVFINNMF